MCLRVWIQVLESHGCGVRSIFNAHLLLDCSIGQTYENRIVGCSLLPYRSWGRVTSTGAHRDQVVISHYMVCANQQVCEIRASADTTVTVVRSKVACQRAPA